MGASRARRLQAPALIAAIAAAAAMAGCSSTQSTVSSAFTSPLSPSAGASRQPMFPESKWGVSASRRVASQSEDIPKGGGRYKVGDPYQVGGRWYNPREQPDYDRIGVASWYGSDFHGRHTANGEVYDMQALTAAHPTLPLPCYAYVTNLANGRTILVRVNDRGPYVAERLIDLSKASAHTLGLFSGGTGRVRVRYAGPAPLDGDDSRERQFLASRDWSGRSNTAALGGSRYPRGEAPAPVASLAPPMQQDWQRSPPPRLRATPIIEPSGWPAPPARPSAQSDGQSYADAGPGAGGTAWSPYAYRSGLVAR